jgi:hypothetical protein
LTLSTAKIKQKLFDSLALTWQGKSCDNQLLKMEIKATVIAESGLKASQVTVEIKAFVIPMSYLRRLINDKIGGLKGT